MGWDIFIGQARGREVALAEASDAPRFDGDEMTGQSNARHPSYSDWGDFVNEAGLRSLFFDPRVGLMRSHPGCYRLTRRHHAEVGRARSEWERAHPHAYPGFGHGQDDVLARLIWLDFWIGWALAHRSPSICNH